MIDARIETAPRISGRPMPAAPQPGLLGEQHAGHQRDGVGLEQVGGHAGVVADVIADVVGDHGRVAGVVLGDAGLELCRRGRRDVGALREDAAAETAKTEVGDRRS